MKLFHQDVSTLNNEEETQQNFKQDMSTVISKGASQRVVKHLVGIIIPQLTEKTGIKKHGKDAVAVLYDAFFQLDDRTVFEGVMVSSLSRKKKRMALRAMNLIKEKRCGKL